MEARIRLAEEADAQAINSVYNHYVRTSTCTWHLTEETEEGRIHWLKGRSRVHPVLVVEVEGKVVGWGSLSTYNSRQGWSATVEDSIFIHHEHHGKGLGKRILRELLTRAEALGHKSVIARISGEQAASLKLHEACGFTHAGLLKGVGHKFGQDLDCAYMLKSLRKP